MNALRLSRNVVVRKIGVRKDNRAVIYLPTDFVVGSEWVIVKKENEKIVIEPIEV